MNVWRFIALTLALTMASVAAPLAGNAQEVPRMSVAELRGKLADPGLVVIDVRTGRDWTGSDRIIQGAVREEAGRIDWAKKYTPDQTLVLYCT